MYKKLYRFLLLLDMEKVFDRVARKVIECLMRHRHLPEMLVKAVMSLYEGATTKVSFGAKLSEEIFVKVGVH